MVGVEKEHRKVLQSDENSAILFDSEGRSKKGMMSAPANAVPLADSRNQFVNGGQVSATSDGQQVGSGTSILGIAPDDLSYIGL